MKIVFLAAHLQSGGAERTVAYLSSFMAEQGADVKIITLTDNIFYEINPKVKIEKLHINAQPSNPISKIFLAAKRLVKVNHSVIKENPDVVFCMLPDMAKYIMPLHKLGKFKLITSERIN
ncbi:MAG: glycosyltransferase family 4 protein, partial [Ruminococcaceae bacterium]|nr:glycosyltransferase family 4 protein [Oscillospiraceae bacterium]